MRYQKRLLSALVGIALLAIPVTAAAKDHDRDHRANSRPSHEFHFKAARHFTPRRAVPPRFQRSAAPQWHENGWKHDRALNNGTWVPSYGYKTYAPAVVPYSYPAPYSAPSYAYGPVSNYGTSCAQRAQRLRNQAWRDRRTGHPAAAADLEQRMRSLNRECGSGLGGLSAPAYYGYGYGSGYGPGYAGGYNQPSYGYYNNGGLSALAPLVQGFIW
jgi:Ni/Co efflux regulator RcnB